jgi:hypothetical protein
MLASSVDMFAFPFMPPLPALVICFSYYIVISGPRLSLVFRVTNIILLFLMIIRIIYGRFLYVLNPTPFPHCRIFSPMSTLNLVSPFKASKVIMDVNSIISVLGPSLPPTELSFACHAHTLPLKMAKPNALYAPSTMLFAPCYSTQVSRLVFGPLPSVWQLTSSTFFPLKPSLSPHPNRPFRSSPLLRASTGFWVQMLSQPLRHSHSQARPSLLPMCLPQLFPPPQRVYLF